jgi:hypothetical protein
MGRCKGVFVPALGGVNWYQAGPAVPAPDRNGAIVRTSYSRVSISRLYEASIHQLSYYFKYPRDSLMLGLFS